MSRYDFRCLDPSCAVVQELVQSVHKALPDSVPCPKCGGRAEHVFLKAPAVSTIGMTNAPLDVVIGRDAAARWDDIHRRQDIRNRVRRESGKQSLTMTDRDAFEASDKRRSFVPTPPPLDD